ncbi:hypothetical protein SISNIDRAFT_338944 [Sistotremastrum niveocremeum HHB9708]|uniref:Uncharacterized protein n=2 Tax=Sistotremastraceae TaxID=3402574 RepID=A0A164XND4_9AGAM|nr:hypothetical protein SISNIDRAFT_338944 [Sistotremastrum niveocremeum HHB9708]KZT44520.1 hypothetical protein SISSUDRAFT_1056858 [Sistotremastrum suecicum HHB10207 ss-3]
MYTSLFPTRRRDGVEWEVEDHKVVQSVPTSYADEDIDITSVSDRDTNITYSFYATPAVKADRRRAALEFARDQLLKEVSKQRHNVLLMEGWTVTTFRKGASRRIEVRYSGRPAVAVGNIQPRKPPFMGILDADL